MSYNIGWECANCGRFGLVELNSGIYCPFCSKFYGKTLSEVWRRMICIQNGLP
jgi:hypothetical protein